MIEKIVKSIIATAFLFLILFRCSIQKPEAPQFQVPVNLVLIDTTYSIEELSSESDNLSINESSVLEIGYRGEIDTIKVEDELSLDSQYFHSQYEIGDLELIINKSYRDSSLNFTNLLPGIDQYHNTSQVIAPFSFSYIQSDSIRLEDVRYATISSGTAVVTIENYLPVPINPPLIAEIYNKNQELIRRIEFTETIPANNGKVAKTVDLANTRFSSPLYLFLSGQSSGSGGNYVNINIQEDYVVIDIFVETITASEVTAQMDPVLITSNKEINLTDKINIQEAEIFSGNLDLHLKNDIPLGVNGTITFEDIFDQTGASLKLDVSLGVANPSSEWKKTIQLNGYIIKPLLVAGGQLQTTKVNVKIQTEDTGSEVVKVKSNDSIVMEVSLTDIKFLYVTGMLERTELAIPPYSTEVDLPEGVDNLQFNKARLNLDIYNRINFPVEVDVNLKGISKSNQVVNLSIQEILPPRGFNAEAILKIQLNESNSNILPFINNLPTKIEITGNSVVGGDNNIFTIHRDDYVRAIYDISAPLQMIFEDKIIKLDTTELSILPENYEDDVDGNSVEASIMDHLVSATMKVAVANHLPLGMKIQLVISEDLATLFSNPDLLIGPIEIPAGVTDGNGDVIAENTKSNDISLSDADLNIFKNNTATPKTIYIGTEIYLDGSDGKLVSVYNSDYLMLNATINLTVDVNTDE